MARKSEIFFIRHGERSDVDGGVSETGLTHRGVEEAQFVGRYISEIASRAPEKAFTFESKPAISSSTFAIFPDVNVVDVSQYINRLADSRALELESVLTYREITYPPLEDIMTDVYNRGINLQWLSKESSVYEKYDQSFSSFDRIVRSVGSLVSNIHRSDYGVVVCCSRESIYSCFRANLIEMAYGDEMKLDYINWYCEKVEQNESARTQVARITITESVQGEKMIVDDLYDVTELSTSLLSDYDDK